MFSDSYVDILLWDQKTRQTGGGEKKLLLWDLCYLFDYLFDYIHIAIVL